MGVGTTHISHIETGNTIPSLKTVIDIINALHCSADELLCIEIEQARPRFNDWFVDLLAGCSDREIKIISGTVKALIESLQHFGTDEKKAKGMKHPDCSIYSQKALTVYL